VSESDRQLTVSQHETGTPRDGNPKKINDPPPGEEVSSGLNNIPGKKMLGKKWLLFFCPCIFCPERFRF
jgi:hypothetical protein